MNPLLEKIKVRIVFFSAPHLVLVLVPSDAYADNVGNAFYFVMVPIFSIVLSDFIKFVVLIVTHKISTVLIRLFMMLLYEFTFIYISFLIVFRAFDSFSSRSQTLAACLIFLAFTVIPNDHLVKANSNNLPSSPPPIIRTTVFSLLAPLLIAVLLYRF